MVITGGDVLDPSAGYKGIMDVGIAGGKILEVGPNLPQNQARKTLSAKGKYVFPGLVDMHAHVFVNGHDMGCCTDRFCKASGVTSLIVRLGKSPWARATAGAAKADARTVRRVTGRIEVPP